MASFRNMSLLLTAAIALGRCCGAQQAQTADLLDRAENAVVSYVNKLADVHCTENVEQVKVQPNGKTGSSIKTQYDYFVLLQGNSLDLQLAESRLAIGNVPQKQPPMLLSNGFSMLLLIFHPYYRGSFAFTPEVQEQIAGRGTVRYHFAHISGTRSPAALALREREYPLDLQGSAWLDVNTGQPLRMEAELLQPMTDIGLRSLKVRVEYAPVAALAGHPVLASLAEVDLETPRQHWRNSHEFRDYKLFTTDASQDANVKVHPNPGDAQGNPSPSSTQEKP